MSDAGSSDQGVAFPFGGNARRSTTGTGRAIFADAVRPVDASVAARIEHTSDWRSGYVGQIRAVVHAAAQRPAAAVTIAREGLDSAYRRFEFVRGTDTALIAEAMASPRGRVPGSVTVRGRADPEPRLTLPYRGRRLFGDDLRRQLDSWVREGVAEHGVATAIGLLLDNPDWLDLHDLDIAVLGAGAELAPTRSLLRWGAHVHAVDLPRAQVWERLIATARTTAGSLRIPIVPTDSGAPPFIVGGPVHPEDDAIVARHAGADLIREAPEIAEWLLETDRLVALGTYAYADGARHALLSMAADAISGRLLAERSDVTLAYLATPTDVFMVPFDAVEESRRRWRSRRIGAIVQGPLRLLRLFEQNYPQDYTTDAGRRFGINDSLITQQGPNYALAKHLQRWRAITAAAAGTRVSMNLAPATRTQSVVRNRALAAAYAGAGRFGVEVFEPATATTLMAALLVHDLRNPTRPSAGDNPMDALGRSATHGGLWRVAYAPRSVLGVAAVLGMFESRS